MTGTPRPEGKPDGNARRATISTKTQRIAKLAKQAPQMAFTSLAHHIDIEWLTEAYRRTRKDGAVGVDGQTATDYAANLEANLQSLLDPPPRHPDLRGQSPPKSGADGAGGDLRAGLPAL